MAVKVTMRWLDQLRRSARFFSTVSRCAVTVTGAEEEARGASSARASVTKARQRQLHSCDGPSRRAVAPVSISRTRQGLSAVVHHANGNGNGDGGSDATEDFASQLKQQLEIKRAHFSENFLDCTVNERAVFTNSDLSLKRVGVYGFDFDCTLVHYTPEVHRLIYETARDMLVSKFDYPAGIQKIPYDPNFAIRGLHYDIKHGLLMKVDSYNHIQMSSVHRGRTALSANEIYELYGGTHIPLQLLEKRNGGRRFDQFLDIFSIPEVTLLADITDYLINTGIPYAPEYLYVDVQSTVRDVHLSMKIHEAITKDFDRFVCPSKLHQLLSKLKQADKKLFLITNSPFWFVDKGMTHVMKSRDWRDLFDVVIVGAGKPEFFCNNDRPFRVWNTKSQAPMWQEVTQMVPGEVYYQGNVLDFTRMTGWVGGSVLYQGDHVYSDLAEPILQHGWKTGAIIPELGEEIRKANSHSYKDTLSTLLAVEKMLQQRQPTYDDSPDFAVVREQWKKRRSEARKQLREVFNPQFGSVFRTERCPTYFSQRLGRFANLYMSSLDNLLDYSLEHNFFPRRSALPHEPDVNFDL